MAKILSFPGHGSTPADPEDEVPQQILSQEPPPADRKPPKFGFTRVRRNRRGASAGQLDLFVGPTPPSAELGAKLLVFPGATSSFEQALLDDEAGNEAAARSGYLSAIDAEDSTSDAYCNLGILEYMADNSEIAFDCFRQALKHDQRHWESHYNLGNLYFDAGQHDPSRVHYEVAAEIEPGFRNVHFNLALILALEADYGAAVQALECFRDLAPEEEAAAAEELLDTLRASQAHAEARRSPD
jgi:tetratricopeptide (TPR) repeat protein